MVTANKIREWCRDIDIVHDGVDAIYANLDVFDRAALLEMCDSNTQKASDLATEVLKTASRDILSESAKLVTELYCGLARIAEIDGDFGDKGRLLRKAYKSHSLELGINLYNNLD